MAKIPLNVIWCHPPSFLWEEDWIRWLLADFQITESYAPDLDVFHDNAIYILSSNFAPLSAARSKMMTGLRSVEGKGLLHLSDEWYSGGYEIYTEFDFVLRNYYSRAFEQAGIMTLPLGLTNGAANLHPAALASERRYLWSFSGSRTAARMTMYRQFKDIEPGCALWYDMRRQEAPPLDRAGFKNLLAQTVFQPCPMGNVTLETFRLYESLEMGCIPLIEQRPWLRYYDRLLPGHPLPRFTNWSSARAFVEAHRSDPARLDALQRTVHHWWQDYKQLLRKSVMKFTNEGLEGKFKPALRAGRAHASGMGHQLWRLQELVRHGNRASLVERVGLVAAKMAHLR